jgi:hypothetical protein
MRSNYGLSDSKSTGITGHLLSYSSVSIRNSLTTLIRVRCYFFTQGFSNGHGRSAGASSQSHTCQALQLPDREGVLAVGRALCGVPRFPPSTRIGRKRRRRVLDDARDEAAGFSLHPKQALAAILFLYKEVLGIKTPWVTTVVRAKRPHHLPVVLTSAEVERVLCKLQGANRVIASLLYGAGLRVSEGLQLRVKDIDLEYR